MSYNFARDRIWYAAHFGRPDGVPRPPVILIHGAGGSHLDWPGALRRVAGVDTFAIDLPGHGRSSPPGQNSIDAYVQDVCAWMDALAIPEAIFCGHSMGGGIAQTIAFDAPDRVAALILMGTGARLRVSDKLLEDIVHDPNAALDVLARWLWGPGPGPGQEENKVLVRQRLGQMPPAVMHGDLLACNAFNTISRLGEIDAPTLVISGTDDKMTPLKYGSFLAEQIPDAELVAVEGAGHMLAIEQPEQVAEAINRFLRRSWG